MNTSWRNGLAAGATLCGVILLGPACQPGTSGGEPTAPGEKAGTVEVGDPDQEVTIELSKDGTEGWGNIPPVQIRTGTALRFVAPGAKAWIVIPSGVLEHRAGRGEWCAGRGFVAFEVVEGGTTIGLTEEIAVEETVHYSVMVEREGAWSYVHGENPPPRMIIGP